METEVGSDEKAFLLNGTRKIPIFAGYASKYSLAFRYLEDQHFSESDGHVSLNQCCSVAGLGGNPYRDGSYEYYISEPVRSNDPKGTGPFILASLEMEQLQQSEIK